MNSKLEIANAKAIHICNSHEPTLNPKIAKEYVLPTLRKMLTKLREMERIKKAQHLTISVLIAGTVKSEPGVDETGRRRV